MKGLTRLTRWWSGGGERLSAMDAYARWAPDYPPHAHNLLMQAEQSVVAGLLRAAAPRRALDVGTGTGRNLHLLDEAGARLVVGIDLSASMLMHGSTMFPRVRGDALHLPFRSGSFDLVSSSLMCGDVGDLGGWLHEAARMLTWNGHLIYSDFHPSWGQHRWRRTFSDRDGSIYELPLHPHAIEEHVQRLESVGLTVRAIREPRVAGKPAPVVVVLHAVKLASRVA
jgi:malonyl-CoA O-methyltransferase